MPCGSRDKLLKNSSFGPREERKREREVEEEKTERDRNG